MFKRIGQLLFFFVPWLIIAVCLVMVGLGGILGNIDPEKADRETLVRMMQVRDFRHFSPDLLKRITIRAEQEFGRHAVQKPEFQFAALEKNIYSYFMTHRSNKKSYLEYNLTLMAKTRYFQWMQDYQSATAERKAELMNEVIEEMRYWQNVYFDYLRSIGLPEPTLAELYQDFKRMIDQFKEGATPEDVVLIDLFAQNMIQALFAAEVKKSISDFLPFPFQKTKAKE